MVCPSISIMIVSRTFEELLLQFSLCDLNFNGLVDLFGVSLLVVGVVFDCSREKCVDECRLS